MAPLRAPGVRPVHVAVAALALALLAAGWAAQNWAYSHTPHASLSIVHPKLDFPLPFRLEEFAARAGLVHRDELFEPSPVLRNIGPLLGAIAGDAVAVVDINGDGWPDVYVTSSKIGSMNRLFINQKDGTFREEAARYGLADVNRTAGSLKPLFFDYDNDGRQDLFLTTTYCPRLFHQNADGRFEDVTERSGIKECAFTSASNVIDYDRDGALDLVVAQHFKDVDLSDPKRFDFMWENGSWSANGGAINVYHNEKGKGGTIFRRVPGALGIKSRGWSFSVGVYDLRGTGRQDLYFAMTHGSDQLYLNDGGGRLRDYSEHIPKGDSHGAMSTEVADVDNDGRPFVMVTDDHEPGRDPSINFLWKSLAGERFQNRSELKGVHTCGFAWGSKFIDLDNDGRLDLVVANGFLSENPDHDYRYIMDSLVGGGSRKITADPRAWPPMNDSSIEGFQEACVFYNVGSRFVDASYDTPFRGDIADKRGVAAIDFDNDGRVGFLMSVRGGLLRAYRTIPPAANRWIGFKLTGTKSARDAFGARVVLTLKDGRRLSRELEPGNGFLSESDARLHFGLGPGGEVESAEVRWPLGLVETYRGLESGRYHQLTEGRGPRLRALDGVKLVYPDRRDARWLQTLFLGSFVVFALSSPSFTRSPSQLAASAATGLLLSAALAWLRTRALVLPFSALISSLGIVLLCNSPFVWTYAAVAAVSIISREFLRVDGRHVFNPTNFGLTFCLLFLSGSMTTTSSRWGGSPVAMVPLACLGTLVVWRANRLDVSLSYAGGWLAGSWLYARAADLPLTPVLAPFTGAEFMLFTFFMVTDPVTTPSTRTRRVVFGLVVGIAENVFRYYQARNAAFYGLFLVTAFVPLFEAWLGRREQPVWKPRELVLGAGAR